MAEHYFSETPSGDFRPRPIEVTLAGAPRQITTSGGVFSADELDRGTEILLKTLERPDIEDSGADQGPILDLGCGWGPIALTAALRHPDAEVWAVDINTRARELATLNATQLGLQNVRVVAPEDVPADMRFGAIHSNPPIRIGKEALHEMLSLWLPRLLDGGSAHLVVAKHLGADSLQRWIAETFPELQVSRARRDKGFHIIAALRD